MSGVVRDITVSASTGPTTYDKSAEIWIRLPASFDMLQDTLVINLSGHYTNLPYARVNIGNPGGNISYMSNAGTLTITRLAESEIEGSFQCTVKNEHDDEDSITIWNGIFKGKF